MPSEPRPSFYTLRTTHGHQATIYVAHDDDPWQAAAQYVRASFASDSHLAELRIASEAEIAVFSGRAFQRQSPIAVIFRHLECARSNTVRGPHADVQT